MPIAAVIAALPVDTATTRTAPGVIATRASTASVTVTCAVAVAAELRRDW